MPDPISQPDDEELRELLEGRVSQERETEISQLLDTNPNLQRRLEQLSGAGSFSEEFDAVGFDPNQKSPTTGYETFLTDSDHEGAIGCLGKFHILEEAGRGGMGVVLKAYDADLERVVAIKWLDASLTQNMAGAQRFHHEATSIAAMENPHVLPIYSVEEIEGHPFLVTRYVNGETLEDRLRRSSDGMEVEEATRIAEAVADGLSAAHEAGLIHRDVKPSNIMLEDGGEKIWLMDFGLVKISAESQVTREGTLIGTPHYMSPEQATGLEVDARSDLYSLGVVLFHMITGRVPFQSDHLSAVLWQIAETEAPNLSELHPGMDPKVAKLVNRLLDKDPDERFSTAGELRAALAGKEMAGQPKSRPLKVIVPLVFVVLFAIGAIALVKYLEYRKETLPITLAGSYQRFSDLSLALEKAPSDSIVEIQSNKEFTLSPVTLQRSVTLRAGPDHSPTINCIQGESPIIQTDSGLTIEGLSINYITSGLDPPPLVESSGELFSMRYCRFVIPANLVPVPTRNPGHMISLLGPGKAILERTEILSSFAGGMMFTPTENVGHREIVIRESLLFIRGVIAINRGVSGSSTEVRMTDSIVSCRNASGFGELSSNEDSALPTFKAIWKGNVIDCEHSMVFTMKETLVEMFETASWETSNNRYSIGDQFMITTGGSRNFPIPKTFEDWKEYTDSGEPGSIAAPSKYIPSSLSPPINALDANFRKFRSKNLKSNEKIDFDYLRIGPAGRQPTEGDGEESEKANVRQSPNS